MLTVNNQVMAGFSAEDQDVIRQAALEATKEQIDVVRKGLIAPDLSALKTLEDNGMEVTVLDEATRAEFKAKTTAIYEKWVPIVGEDLFKKAEAAIAGSRK